MASSSSARLCVVLATLAILVACLTQMTSAIDLPYSDEDNLAYDVMDRPGGTPDVWQKRTIDTLLEALMLLREEMELSTEDKVKPIMKKSRSHYLFWRSPVLNGPKSQESARKRTN